MPKMKSHSGAKKRFKLTAKGRVKAHHAMTSHNLGKKSAKRKRHLGKETEITGQDAANAKRMLQGQGR